MEKEIRVRLGGVTSHKAISNAFIFVLSIVVGLLLCEWGARLVLNPVDYLSPSRVSDNILGMRLPPKSSGHDEWGFRNRRVPSSADIVAIGDSHTYGNTAKMTESWPFILEKLTGRDVYNLGMGGYGPNQYYYLLKTKALALKPKVILCGLWMGDEFDGAFKFTYWLDYWKFLRSKNLNAIPDRDRDIWEITPQVNWHKDVRNWLSKHSIVYRLAVHGLFSQLKGSLQIRYAPQFYESTSTIIIKEKNIEEAFLPKDVLRGLDQNKSSVKEGMRITFRLLKEMNEICQGNGIQFIVVIIPTKELVFSRYIEHNKNISMSETIDQVIENERIARKKLQEFFTASKILFVDSLGRMEEAIDREKLYAPSAVDIHPNKNGYRVIAEVVSDYLQTLDQAK